MKNIKSISEKLITLSFFHKKILKIFPKPISLGHSLTFSMIENNHQLAVGWNYILLAYNPCICMETLQNINQKGRKKL